MGERSPQCRYLPVPVVTIRMGTASRETKISPSYTLARRVFEEPISFRLGAAAHDTARRRRNIEIRARRNVSRPTVEPGQPAINDKVLCDARLWSDRSSLSITRRHGQHLEYTPNEESGPSDIAAEVGGKSAGLAVPCHRWCCRRVHIGNCHMSVGCDQDKVASPRWLHARRQRATCWTP